MSETQTGTGKLAAVGAVQPMSGRPGAAPVNQAAPASQQSAAEGGEGDDKGPEGNVNTGNDDAQQQAGGDNGDAKTLPELTKEQIKELYEKNFPTETAPTDEQKKTDELAFEKRMHDLFIEQGGKGDQFYRIKEVAAMDLTTLSQAQLTEEMKAAGFSDDEISAMRVQRYYQINPEELEQGVEEEDVDFEKRKELVKKQVAYGTAKFQKKGEHIKSDAQSILDTLKDTLKDQDLQRQQAVEFTAKVNDTVKAMPRKLSVDLGKLDNQDLGSVQIDVTDQEVEEVGAILRDPVQLNQILYNDKGVINVERISQLLLIEKTHAKSAREALLEGQTRQVEIFRKRFPVNNPAALGVRNGSSSGSGGSGKIVSVGKPTVVNPAQRVAK